MGGERFVAVAWEAPGSRGDAAQAAFSATSDGERWRLDGAATSVLDGHVASDLLIPAQTAGGLAVFRVAAEHAQVRRLVRIDGRNAAQVDLDGVSGTVLLEADATASLEAALDRARITLAAEMLGGATEAFERTIGWLREREQFGVPIGTFQALQHRAARLYVELTMTRSAVRAAARAVDEDPDAVPRLASLAKAVASDTFERVTAEAVQMHGGVGVTDEHDIGLYFKRARVAAVTFGDAAFHRRRWARLGGY